jgi:hypothetical protein
MYNEYTEFVQSELTELESKDPDTLFVCIKENLIDMGIEVDDEILHSEIERQLEGEELLHGSEHLEEK